MVSVITHSEMRVFLAEQMPTAPLPEIERASSALVLMFKLASTTPTTKVAPKKQRQYKEKSIAESQNLKR